MSIESRMESEQERLPTKEEIFELLGLEVENCIILKELSDEKGLYRLDVKDGDNEYMYTRANSPHPTSETDIYLETPTTHPENIYRYVNGAWKKLS